MKQLEIRNQEQLVSDPLTLVRDRNERHVNLYSHDTTEDEVVELRASEIAALNEIRERRSMQVSILKEIHATVDKALDNFTGNEEEKQYCYAR